MWAELSLHQLLRHLSEVRLEQSHAAGFDCMKTPMNRTEWLFKHLKRVSLLPPHYGPTQKKAIESFFKSMLQRAATI
eukprot:2383908-Amphidinium_carterae.1